MWPWRLMFPPGYPFDQWKGDIVIASVGADFHCTARALKNTHQNNVENSIIDFNDPYHYALSFDGISLEDSLLYVEAKSTCHVSNAQIS